jgi:hypothetical protein
MLRWILINVLSPFDPDAARYRTTGGVEALINMTTAPVNHNTLTLRRKVAPVASNQAV